jgi:hypothetical protein
VPEAGRPAASELNHFFSEKRSSVKELPAKCIFQYLQSFLKSKQQHEKFPRC